MAHNEDNVVEMWPAVDLTEVIAEENRLRDLLREDEEWVERQKARELAELEDERQ